MKKSSRDHRKAMRHVKSNWIKLPVDFVQYKNIGILNPDGTVEKLNLEEIKAKVPNYRQDIAIKGQSDTYFNSL